MNQSISGQIEVEEVMTPKEAEQLAKWKRGRKMPDFMWNYSPESKGTIFIQDSSNRTFGIIDSVRIGPEEAERRANLFIASADLLTALKTLTPSECPIVTHHSPDCGFCFAIKVIAKAEGK